MSNNINFDYKNLSPFKWFVLENFPFIEADFDALTEWQLFCKLGKEINKIIDSQNIVGEQAENLTNAFNNLKNYVDNYFDNLDVQEEINNKLNAMVEDGTLQEIMASYLNSKAVFGFDTVADMKQATNLIDGSFASTYGYYSINDGGAGKYKIRIVNTNDIIDEGSIIRINDTLVAELINNKIVNVKQFGAKTDGISDDTSYINNAIKYLARNNGGTLEGIKNTTSLIDNTIYLLDKITYLFTNYTLKGNGNNTIMITGKYDVDSNELIETYSMGEHFVESAGGYINVILDGAIITNAKYGIKGFGLCYNSIIQNCKFDNNITEYAIDSWYDWGLRIFNNKFNSPINLLNFIDWVVIDGNEFEGMIIQEKNYGIKLSGSHSCKIVSNGFHNMQYGIIMANEIHNTEISNNHFEGNDSSIFNNGTNSIIQNVYIHNNWFFTTLNTDYAIDFKSLQNSKIEYNYYTANKIRINGGAIYSNIINYEDSILISSIPEKFDITNNTEFNYTCTNSQNGLQNEKLTKNFTVENYIHKHDFSKRFPLCTISYSGGGTVFNIKTFVEWDTDYGVRNPVIANVLLRQDRTYVTNVILLIAGKTVTTLSTSNITGEKNPNVSISSTDDNKLQISFSGAYWNDSVGYIKNL